MIRIDGCLRNRQHAYGTAPVFAVTEVWYLNFGSSKLMRRLLFSNGLLQCIDELGYGVGYTVGTVAVPRVIWPMPVP